MPAFIIVCILLTWLLYAAVCAGVGSLLLRALCLASESRPCAGRCNQPVRGGAPYPSRTPGTNAEQPMDALRMSSLCCGHAARNRRRIVKSGPVLYFEQLKNGLTAGTLPMRKRPSRPVLSLSGMLLISSRGRRRGPRRSVTHRLIRAMARSDAGTEASKPNKIIRRGLTCKSRQRANGKARMTAVSSAIVPRYPGAAAQT